MKLMGENSNTRRKPCPSATLSTLNPKLTVWGQTGPSSVRGRPEPSHSLLQCVKCDFVTKNTAPPFLCRGSENHTVFFEVPYWRGVV
jgi:hypothetical protein